MLRPGFPLETTRLRLRPFEAGGLDELHAFHSLPEVARFLYWEGRDLEQVRAVLELGFDGLGLRREGHFIQNEARPPRGGRSEDGLSGGRPG